MIRLKDILSEIGEGSAKAYSYRIDDDFPGRNEGTEYRDIYFKTEDGDNYIVSFKAFHGPAAERGSQARKLGSYFQIDFNTQDDQGFDDDAERVVNKGRLFRIMATIVKAAEEFLDHIDYKEKGIDKMYVYPAKSKKSDHRRANLYMAYIKKHLPIASIKYNGQMIMATLR
jgi:hypothetical protein|tara:strand:- start:37 stop:549 length:513 start_codon:yes stop_codon:yes gene_type:complete